MNILSLLKEKMDIARSIYESYYGVETGPEKIEYIVDLAKGEEANENNKGYVNAKKRNLTYPINHNNKKGMRK